jgi:hypothetical protein
MALYFVEGTVSVRIDVEVEANSLEDAEKKALNDFISEQFHLNISGSDLNAGQYDGETYNN